MRRNKTLITGEARLSLGYQVVIAILAGIFCGLFFGPLCEIVRPVGEVYVMLLQMVALPYILFSLVHGLGSITPEVGKKLFLRGWPFWVSLWAIILATIYLLSVLIPKPLAAVMGQGAGIEKGSLSKNFLNYLVPENPFYDLANNVVPAIAVFGLIVGVSLMHLEKKEPVLSLLERANQMIEKVLKWLAILSPIGIFAHIAVAAGTVHLDDLYAIEFYVACFIFATLFITFWVLPTLLTSLTPLTYGEVMKAFRIVCLLPFATGLPTIALPFINYYMKRLGEKQEMQDQNFHGTSQTVMPLCYSFGQIGNCLILFFILFISFYYRHPFSGSDKTLLSILTIPMSVGSASSISAVSFLIQQMHFPPDAIELFTETLALTLNFQVLLSIASVLTFIILVLYAYYGLIQVKWAQLGSRLGIGFALLIAIVWIGKGRVEVDDNYKDLYLDLKISEVISDPVSSKISTQNDLGTVRTKEEDSAAAPLGEILKTGVLKVGYDERNIPYCYFNRNQELVGFDVAYAYQLARDLDCTLEFVPLHIERLGEQLDEGKFDIAMAAVLMSEDRILKMDFTHPYTEQDNVLIVSEQNRSQFASLDQVISWPGLKIGAIGGYKRVVERHFPLAQLISAPEMGEALSKGLAEAWVSSYTPAFVWCLSNPDFIAAEYGGLIGKRYFAYPIRSGAIDWGSFLNNWLILKDQSGFKKEMTSYWIEGESPKRQKPRWSIIRNVLEWVQ